MPRDVQGRGTGRSYFGEISDRLRRFLGVDGVWPIDVQQAVVPVIIAGDATLPGMNPYVGRRWFANFAGALGAAQGVTFCARSQAVVLDRILLSASLAQTLQVRLGLDPGGGTDQSTILDGALNTGERAGVFSLASAALASTVTCGTIITTANQASIAYELGVRLNAGLALQLFAAAGAPTVNCLLVGRVAQEL